MKSWKELLNANKERRAENIGFFFALLFVFLGYALFYRHYLPVSWDGGYHTLFAKKLFHESLQSMAAQDPNIPIWAITYPLYHLSLKFLAFLLGGRYYAASYVILAFCVVLAILVYRILAYRFAAPENRKERVLCDILSICSVIFLAACSPLTQWRFYARQCGANPVHNPTILFVRPLGLLAVLFFLLFLDQYEKKEKSLKSLLGFGIFSLLSVFAKPNFAFVFLPALALLTLCKMISKKDIKLGIYALIAALPSALAMLFQFTFVTDSTEAMHVVLSFGSFSEFTPLEVLAVSLATFPVPLILFSPKIFRKEMGCQVAYFALVIGWIQMFLLTNGPSGDFSWGYDLAVQFSTLAALAYVAKYKMPAWRRGIAWGVFAYQTVCGLIYLALVFLHAEILI